MDQVKDEIESWGRLKHDNIIKVFIWYEDFSENPHNKMYLMMQYSDLGEISTFSEE